jgi:hypothetical protein
MRKLTTFLLVLMQCALFAQRVKIVDPPFVIYKTGEYGTLGNQKSFLSGNAIKWYYYKSDSLGNVTKLKWRLTDYFAADSSTAVTSLPSGFAEYELPCRLYDGQIAGVWTPDTIGYTLKIREFSGLFWTTQVVDDNTFVVRGKNMFLRDDVALTDSSVIHEACYPSLAGDTTGVFLPPSFTTPTGHYRITLQDGTIAYSTIPQAVYYYYTAYGPYNSTDLFGAVNISTESTLPVNTTSQIIQVGSEMFAGSAHLSNKYYGVSTSNGYKEIHINTIGVVDAIKNVIFQSSYIETQLALKVATYNGEPQTNYIDWEAFPDITLEANVKVGYGSLVQFSQSITGANLLTNTPAPLRKGFTNVGNVASYPGTSIRNYYSEASPVFDDYKAESLIYQGYAQNYGSALVGRGNTETSWKGHTFLFNNEAEAQNQNFFNHYVAKGAIDYAIAGGNENFIYLDYQLLDLPQFVKFSRFYYDNGDGPSDQYRIWWPYFDKTQTEVTRTLVSSGDTSGDSTLIMFDSLRYDNVNYQRAIDNYALAALPDTVSLYQKSGSAFVLDSWGNRIVKNEDITAKVRNKIFTLRTWGDRDANGLLKYCNYITSEGASIPGWKKDGVCYQGISESPPAGVSERKWPYGANRIFHNKHQAERAIHGLSQVTAINISSLIARNKEQFGTSDITEYREDVKWDYVPIFREETESVSAYLYVGSNMDSTRWQGLFESHPISNYQANGWFFQAMVLFGRAQLWNGQGYKIPRPMGQRFDYLNVNTGLVQDTPYDMSIINNITAGIHYIESLHDNKGLWSDTDKILTFMEPSRVQDGEIVALGRMNENNVFLMLAEPRLDIDETMDVTVSNTENGTTYTRTVTARDVNRFVYTLPPSIDTYEADEIIISYVPLKRKDADGGSAIPFVLSGDLLNHVISE